MLTDMQTTQVYNAGKATSGLREEASAAGTGFLTAVMDAKGTVLHTTVVPALEAYHDRWSQPANQMAVDVDALGNNTSGSAVEIQTADIDASASGNQVALANNSLATRINGGEVLAV